MTTLLAQLSDPHLRVDDADASAEALARAVDAVNRLDPGPQAAVVSGDLVDDPGSGEYERVRELLTQLRVPVHVLGGNHDDPDALHEHFPLATAVTGGDYRYAADVGDLRLIACDTFAAGTDAGALGPERRAWLASLLDEAVDRPTVVAMHHPPIDIGIDALDKIRIPDADAGPLAAALGSRPQVRRLICGHVHRGAVGAFSAGTVFTCPSSHLAAELEIGVGGDPDALELIAEPPAFAVHALLPGGELVSHVQPIGEA